MSQYPSHARLPDLFERLAHVNGFFALDLDPGPGAGWQPMRHQLTDVDVVRTRIDEVSQALAHRLGIPSVQVPRRTAASLMQVGISSRIVTPLVACAMSTGWTLGLQPDDLLWRDRLHNSFPLAARRLSTRLREPSDVLLALAESAVRPLLVPFNEAVRAAVPVSPKVLWGNVLAAIGNAVALCLRHDLVGEAAAGVSLAGLLEHPQFKGLGHLWAGPALRRRTCCLYYILEDAGYCSDCVLLPAKKWSKCQQVSDC